MSSENKFKHSKIPEKYLNYDFLNFVINTFPLEVNGMKITVKPIRNRFGSLEEWSYHFQLEEFHGITLQALIKFLYDKGCITTIDRKENVVHYHQQNIIDFINELEDRLKR